METTERIVEAYVRHVMGCATITNIRCKGQHEIDLLAIHPSSLERYHIEVTVSISGAYSKLTDKGFSPAALKQRSEAVAQRRTIGFFVERKFGLDSVRAKLREFGFEEGEYKRVIVSWGWTDGAKEQADALGIELWDFRQIITDIAEDAREKRTYFTDDTLRTLHLFVRAMDEQDREDPAVPVAPSGEDDQPLWR